MFALRSSWVLLLVGRCDGVRAPLRAPQRAAKHLVVDMFGYLQTQKRGVPLLGGLSSTYHALTEMVDGQYQPIITNNFPGVKVHAALFQGVWEHGDGGEDDMDWLVWKGLHAQPDDVEKVYHITRDKKIATQVENAVTALKSKVDTEFVAMGNWKQSSTRAGLPKDLLKFFGMEATCEGSGPVNVVLGGKGKSTKSGKMRMSLSDYVPYTVFTGLVKELLECNRVQDVLIVWDSSFDGNQWVPFVETLPDHHKDRVVLVHASKKDWDSAQWRQSFTVQQNGQQSKRFITVQMSGVTTFVNNRAVLEHHRFNDREPDKLAICEAAFGVKTFADYLDQRMYRAKGLEASFSQHHMCAAPLLAGNLNLELRDFAMDLREYKIGGVVNAKTQRSKVEELFNLQKLKPFITEGLVAYPNSATARVDERRWSESTSGWAPQWPENQPLMDYEGFGTFILSLEKVRRKYGTNDNCMAQLYGWTLDSQDARAGRVEAGSGLSGLFRHYTSGWFWGS